MLDESIADKSQLKYTLLTGATGLLGEYLLKDLLLKGLRVAVLVRPSKKMTVTQRIEEILLRWEAELQVTLPRPVILNGCLTRRNCGLSASQLSWVRTSCERIVHNAAVLTFVGVDRAREPWVTNVGGTQNILNLCRETGVSDLHYVSTAYVCGEQTGVISETQLDVGQGFRNDYERSKFEAECHVRECRWVDAPTIYRPAVISGDSQTGYTSTYHGLYLYLRLIAMLVPRVPADENGIRHTPIRLPMSGAEPRNVVPVDWVSTVISRLLTRDEARGKTFHIAPDVPLTPRQVVEYCYSYFNSEGVIYCADRPAPNEEVSEFEREFLQNVQLYQAYDRSDPIFDRSNLLQHVGDIRCPEIDEQLLHRYLDYGERDRWGKRRKTDCPHLEQNELPRALPLLGEEPGGSASSDWSTLSVYNSGAPLPPFEIGLDLHGPWGGQWHIVGNGDQTMKVRPGLPLNNDIPILHMSLSDLMHHFDDLERPLNQYFRNVAAFDDGQWCGPLVSSLRQSLSNAK